MITHEEVNTTLRRSTIRTPWHTITVEGWLDQWAVVYQIKVAERSISIIDEDRTTPRSLPDLLTEALQYCSFQIDQTATTDPAPDSVGSTPPEPDSEEQQRYQERRNAMEKSIIGYWTYLTDPVPHWIEEGDDWAYEEVITGWCHITDHIGGDYYLVEVRSDDGDFKREEIMSIGSLEGKPLFSTYRDLLLHRDQVQAILDRRLHQDIERIQMYKQRQRVRRERESADCS